MGTVIQQMTKESTFCCSESNAFCFVDSTNTQATHLGETLLSGLNQTPINAIWLQAFYLATEEITGSSNLSATLPSLDANS